MPVDYVSAYELDPADHIYIILQLPYKRSERLRINSAKGGEPYSYKGKEFVYDYEEGELESVVCQVDKGACSPIITSASSPSNYSEDSVRPCSSSWSNVKRNVAVVERRVRQAVTPKASRKYNKLKAKEGTNPFLEQQQSLSQCRIYLLFKKKIYSPTAPDSEEETEVYLKDATDEGSKGRVLSLKSNIAVKDNKDCVIQPPTRDAGKLSIGCEVATSASELLTLCEDNPIVYTVNTDVDVAKSNVDEVSSVPTSCEVDQRHYLQQYSSDYDSISSSINSAGVSYTNHSQVLSQNRIMEDTAPATVGDIKRLLESMKEDLRTELKRDLAPEDSASVANDILATNTEIATLRKDLKSTETNLKLCQVQLREVSGTCIKQDLELKECKSKLEVVTKRLDKNVLRITGLEEKKEEDCIHSVTSFFKNTVGIEKEIKLVDAHRIGFGKDRAVLAYLEDVTDMSLLLGNAKNLKDKVNKYNKPYFLSKQITAGAKSKRQRQRQLISLNSEIDSQYQKSMQCSNGELLVDGEVYTKELRAPSCRVIILASKQQRLERLNKKMTKRVPKMFKGQEFLAYTAEVKEVQDANVTYAKVRSIHTDARHVICASRMPGGRSTCVKTL